VDGWKGAAVASGPTEGVSAEEDVMARWGEDEDEDEDEE
jgi:hypothetical protein